jgi:prevent-host-death family protein
MAVVRSVKRGPKSRGGDTPLNPGGFSMVQATEAKNRFGAILRSIGNAQPVFIGKHGKAQAVVLDIHSYRVLVRKARGPHEVQLDTLREEFEALHARMQSSKSRKAVDRLFSVSAETLNQVAAKRTKDFG